MATNMKAKNRFVKATLAFGLCAALAATASATPLFTSANAQGIASDGKYYTDFNTLDEAKAAAGELAIQIASEGDTLLKNRNNALPMAGTEFVSVFGVASDSLAGSSGSNFGGAGSAAAGTVSLYDALEDEGFKVNKSLRSFYASDGSSMGSEVTSFDKGIVNSFDMYRDAAIIVLGRGGGEGSDTSTVTKEEAKDETENNGWEHEGYTAQADGKTYKHFLQMTDSEVALLKYVKEQGFKKIIYLINSSYIFELENIEQDDAVDAILWIGRPGATGTVGAARILSGKVNPSGKTVDTWYKDLTADPTWQNAINNAQVGSSNQYLREGGEDSGLYGIDYEEGIYVGYRYYETRGYEESKAGNEDWYDEAVTYPFGYGLSYTSYKYSNFKVNEVGGAAITANKTITGDDWASKTGTPAKVKQLKVSVDVTNTGSVAGKETVEIYVQAPYVKGEVEKSHVKLVGFGKTETLKPGATQTLTITVNVQDMASYDATDANKNSTKGYELDAGDYTLMATANSHGWADPNAENYQAINFTLSKDVYLQLDDFSDNAIENLFSAENGMFYTLRDNTNAKYQFNADETANETQMSRADFEGTFPKAPTKEDRTITNEIYQSIKYWNQFDADGTVQDADPDDDVTIPANTKYADGQKIEGIVDEEDFPWMDEVTDEAMEGWTQATNATYPIKLSEMAGIDPYGKETVVSTNELINGKTESEAWKVFMNTLTWQDLMDLAGQLQKRAHEGIGMNALAGQDSAWNYASTFNFTCNCILTATWNTELSNKKGIMIGNLALLSGNNTWWGGSANTHRSPFGGRWFEYTSEDSILGGYISAGEMLGANSRGLVSYMKHCALNDQETNRNSGNMLSAWVSEQAIRELYYKSFQICAQEGQSMGEMGAFAAAGRVAINVNYNIITKLFKDEWGCDMLSHTTDNYGGYRNAAPLDLLVRAGTDNIATSTMSGTWNAEKNTVMLGDTESDVTYYVTRKCAVVFLWTHANSAMNKNGVVTSGWTVPALSATQGTAASGLSVAGDISGATKVEYVITSGALPQGLTLNANGNITGTPTAKGGEYNFTVQLRADNWITATKQVTLTLASAFDFEEFDNDGVGAEYYAEITSETVTEAKYNRGIVYSIKEGVLPQGLILSEDGVIEGTPKEAGTFELTLIATATNVTTGWRGQTTVDVYELGVTIEIEGAGESESAVEFRVEGGKLQYKDGEDWKDVAGAAEAGKSVEKFEIKDGNLIVTYSDNTTADLGKVVGENGKDGAAGAKGEKGDKGDKGETGATGPAGPAGADGKDAEGGCGGVIGAGSAIIAAVTLLGAGAFVLRKKND